MTPAEFDAICSLVTDASGIKLTTGKEALVAGRVGRRLRQLKLTSMADYLSYLRNDSLGEELPKLLDAISTNVTSFFREPNHFEYLRDVVLPRLVERAQTGTKKLRIWSAGCSSGQEPYSIAIHLLEALPGLDQWDARILATDLSHDALEKGIRGTYPADELNDLPLAVLQRYFVPAREKDEKIFAVCDRVRSLVSFGRLNLMGPWPMTGPFDVVFCRNVMIYFDKPTQAKLVERYRQLLASGGTLFIGHSECLTTNRSGYRHIQSTIYEKQ